MAIEQWQVFHVLNCRHALPSPKNKFVVIACVDGGIPYGFFVNSALNHYIRSRSHLLVCESQILSAEHPFLSYDSWVDCRVIYPYTLHELADFRGSLSGPAIAVTLEAVKRCSVLPRRFKKMITG